MRSPPPTQVGRREVAAEQRRVLGGDRQTEAAAPAVARRVGLVEAFEDARRAGRTGRRGRDRRRRRRARRRRRSARPRPARRARARGRCRGDWPRIRSSRRGSVSMTIGVAGTSSVASGRRAATTARTSRGTSIGSRAICSARASNRETSIRSSTSERSRPTSATSSSPARRLSAGSESRCSRRIEASATSAASGVRSSCATSATNRRFWASAASSRPIVSASDSAIRLNRSGPRPELVVRGDRHARRQVAVLEPLGGPAGGLDRRQDAARDDPRDEQRDEISTTVPMISASRSWPSASLDRAARRGRNRRPDRCPRPGRRRPGSAGRRSSSRRRPARRSSTWRRDVGRQRRRATPSRSVRDTTGSPLTRGR